MVLSDIGVHKRRFKHLQENRTEIVMQHTLTQTIGLRSLEFINSHRLCIERILFVAFSSTVFASVISYHCISNE